MKKHFSLLFIFVITAFSSFAQDQLVVDPNAKMRVLAGSFDKIKVSDGIDIYLSQSETESLAVSASEEKYADKIKTVIIGSTLTISYDNSDRGWRGNNKKLKVYIAFKNIDELHASGASDVIVAGTLQASKLEIRLSGASDFKGNVKADELVIDLSGASDVKISGTASLLNLENSGASDFKGYDLAVDICNTKSSGASDVNITVNKELTVNASGASDVYYKGDAIVKTLHSSGASTIAKRDR
ncbi:head GIN domain-containing protein [Ferruginibacter sp. HRS2-29]|uniref:head GIN domain-containing protein n=1 Tax=Ferruginibacter sp. HRS2-29 TaxID=2487334 RepID=UPI0020CFA316|nr:head GIN domain-containing protein [Ferruginibacter sp. HRS2-29]MCP9749505.1 DUF2807 domain-containing protein [Ferruginibacter sp. HRS2-29]